MPKSSRPFWRYLTIRAAGNEDALFQRSCPALRRNPRTRLTHYQWWWFCVVFSVLCVGLSFHVGGVEWDCCECGFSAEGPGDAVVWVESVAPGACAFQSVASVAETEEVTCGGWSAVTVIDGMIAFDVGEGAVA